MDEYLVKKINECDLCRGVGQDQLTFDFRSVFQHNAFDASITAHQNLLHWLSQSIRSIFGTVRRKMKIFCTKIFSRDYCLPGKAKYM